MSTFSRIGRWWERPQQRWYLQLLENLRSRLAWLDVLVGFCATVIAAAILIGFRYQVIPDYKPGQIADQDVRAIQDVTYEDTAATHLKRAEAESVVPIVYQIDADLISDREKAIAAAFSRGREILDQNSVSEKSPMAPALERDLINKLETQVGQIFPSSVVPVLLRQRFNSVLEGHVLKILDAVLRDGIISDRGKFLKDQRTGIVIREGSYPLEHSLTDAYMARDLDAAREYLRQFHTDFSDLRQQDQALLIKYLEDALFPTLLYNRQETESRQAQAVLRVQPVEFQIRQGQTIVRSGEQVTATFCCR